jgi:hypothetical protein
MAVTVRDQKYASALETLGTDGVRNLAFDSIRESESRVFQIIGYIHRTTETPASPGPGPHPAVYEEFEEHKQKLERAGLWSEFYDAQYAKAGELTPAGKKQKINCKELKRRLNI